MVIKPSKLPIPQKIFHFWFFDLQIKIELINALIKLIVRSVTKEVVKLIFLLMPIASTAYVTIFKTNDILVWINPMVLIFFISI